MRRTKLIAGAAVAVFITGITGCGLTVQVNTGEPAQETASEVRETEIVSETGEGDTMEQDGAEITPAHLPEEFYITYEVETDEGTIETWSLARDLNGSVYYDAPGKAALFVKQDSGYVMYQENEDGELTAEEDRKYQDSYVADYVEDIMEYVEQGNIAVSGTISQTGTCEIAGRECNSYSISLNIGNFTQTFDFASDKATGVCLKWENSKNISGVELSGDGSFVCTRFETSGVSLEIEAL